MSTQSHRQARYLLPILAILLLATLALPCWAQAGHTPGMQMETAPAASADDAHAGHQMPGPTSRGIPTSVTVSYTHLTLPTKRIV